MKNSRGSIPTCPSPTSSLNGGGSGGKSNASSKHFSSSKFSLNSQKSDSSEKSGKSIPKPPEEIETIAEKAKFYTSVGLGGFFGCFSFYLKPSSFFRNHSNLISFRLFIFDTIRC